MGEKKYLRKSLLVCFIAGMFVLGVANHGVEAKRKPVLSCKKFVLKVGQKKKMWMKNTSQKVKWSSRNKRIASVNKRGIVTGKKVGKTQIIARVRKKKYICSVQVKENKKMVAITATPVVENPKQTVIPAISEKTEAPMVTLAPVESVETEVPITTQAPSSTPAVVGSDEPTAAPKVSLTPEQKEWEEQKNNGSKEAFEKYFNPDMKKYTKKQEGVTLGKIESISYHSEIVGADREAYVYLPPEYDASKQYPVLYMIHGIGCDRSQWKYLSINNILSNMIFSGELKPLIAILPSVVPKDGLTEGNSLSQENIEAYNLFEKEFLTDLEPYVRKNYGISEKREDTGVCGLSMGGMEALRLGFGIKDHFNYIGSFSAAPSLDMDILNLDGCSYQPETVLLCSGNKDTTIGNNPLNYHQRLMDNQVDHMWYYYPGGTHEDKVWKNGLVNFLLRSFK